MAVNTVVQKLCRDKEVGFVDICGCFVGKADMFMRDGLYFSGKGVAVFATKSQEKSIVHGYYTKYFC